MRDPATARGLLFGSAVNTRQVRSDPEYRRILERECDALVCENETKWQALRPREAEFDFADADIVADYAAGHDMTLRGHTLLCIIPSGFRTGLATTTSDRARRLRPSGF